MISFLVGVAAGVAVVYYWPVLVEWIASKLGGGDVEGR